MPLNNKQTTTSGQSEPESNGKEWLLCIPQSSKTGVSPLDCLVSYPGHVRSGFLPLYKDQVGVFYSPIRWSDLHIKWQVSEIISSSEIIDCYWQVIYLIK